MLIPNLNKSYLFLDVTYNAFFFLKERNSGWTDKKWNSTVCYLIFVVVSFDVYNMKMNSQFILIRTPIYIKLTPIYIYIMRLILIN